MKRSRAEPGAWLIGGAGLVASMAGWWAAPEDFPHAWLASVTCLLGWPLGSLALVFIHALTGGRWGLAIRPQLASGIATLPLAVAALLPLPIVAHALYPWMRSDVAAHLHNRFYLNEPFFAFRCAVYLIVWMGLAIPVLRVLRRPDPQPWLYRWAPPGLILLALTVTFAAVDFTLSMEPQFKSSIYGMLVSTESVLLALSVAVFGMTCARRVPLALATHELGRLLFALLVLWAYLDFMQWLIIWSSNLPDEAGWYGERLMGDWSRVAGAIAVLHFGLPFFALIWSPVQRSLRALRWLSGVLILAEIPRAWWTVIPASGHGLDWLDVATMAAVLGGGAGVALHVFRRLPAAGEGSHA